MVAALIEADPRPRRTLQSDGEAREAGPRPLRPGRRRPLRPRTRPGGARPGDERSAPSRRLWKPPGCSASELAAAPAYEVHYHCIMGVDDAGTGGLIRLLQVNHRWSISTSASIDYDTHQHCVMGMDDLGGVLDTGWARRVTHSQCSMVVDEAEPRAVIGVDPRAYAVAYDTHQHCIMGVDEPPRTDERPAPGPHDAWMPPRKLTFRSAPLGLAGWVRRAPMHGVGRFTSSYAWR